MYKRRRLRRCIYIIFALIFLLVLGMDLYRHIQSRNDDKDMVNNKAITSRNITENNENPASSTVTINFETKAKELNGTKSGLETPRFFVAVYQNRMIVYLEDKKTVYEYTNIDTNELPLELRAKLSDGFFLNGEEELYHFLESYSS